MICVNIHEPHHEKICLWGCTTTLQDADGMTDGSDSDQTDPLGAV